MFFNKFANISNALFCISNSDIWGRKKMALSHDIILLVSIWNGELFDIVRNSSIVLRSYDMVKFFSERF